MVDIKKVSSTDIDIKKVSQKHTLKQLIIKLLKKVITLLESK